MHYAIISPDGIELTWPPAKARQQGIGESLTQLVVIRILFRLELIKWKKLIFPGVKMSPAQASSAVRFIVPFSVQTFNIL
uniref:Uncharacterized protein n=1 Tax=Pararge aegeria TaxID=116150 RepID=S4P6U7_9NEOP